MSRLITFSASITFLASPLLISSCSSGDNSSSAGVPPNAIIITNDNAEPTVESATSSADVLESAVSVETSQIISLKSALKQIKPILNNLSNDSATDTVVGVSFSENCSNGGSLSGSVIESDNGINYSASGTINAKNCNEGDIFLDGKISFSSTENYSTGAYTDDFSGSLDIRLNSNGDSFEFTGFEYSDAGNYFNGTYVIGTLIYELSINSSSIPNGGYLVTLTQPIVESNGDFCPESGHITITGANGTTAEGIYNGDGTMTIKANGDVINPSAACYN